MQQSFASFEADWSSIKELVGNNPTWQDRSMPSDLVKSVDMTVLSDLWLLRTTVLKDF